MPILVADDVADPRLADYRNVPESVLLEQRGLFVAEGRLVVRRLLAGSRFRTRSVMVTQTALASVADVIPADSELPVYVVPQQVMNGITGFNMHRGCLALGERQADMPVAELAEKCRRLMVVERVANADNVGGIFRNVAALAGDGVLLDPATTDPLYRKAIRTSVAAALHVPFARAQSWPDALSVVREAGLVLVALTPGAGADPIERVSARLRDARVALVVGHEGDGLSAAALARCDVQARIRMASGGADSLNVATAAAIALHEFSRCSTS